MTKKKTREKVVRTENFELRLTVAERARLEFLAGQYAGGDMSKWVRYGFLNAPRKHLK